MSNKSSKPINNKLLTVAVLTLAIFGFVVFTQKAWAAIVIGSFSKSDVHLEWEDRLHIKVTVKTVSFTLTDTSGFDDERDKYEEHGSNEAYDCNAELWLNDSVGGFVEAALDAKLDVDYKETTNGTCKDSDPNQIEDIPIGKDEFRNTNFKWVDSETINRIDNDGSWNFKHATDQDRDGNLYFLKEGDSECKDVIIVKPDNTAAFYELDPDPSTGSDYIDAPSETNSGGCKMYVSNDPVSAETETSGMVWARLKNDKPAPGTTAPGSGSGPGAGTGTQGPPTCESQNLDGLDWMLCGMIGAIDNILVGSNGSGGIAGAVDRLLNIDSSYYEDDKLKQVWGYFKNLASLALVLIALIMVVGQALSKE